MDFPYFFEFNSSKKIWYGASRYQNQYYHQFTDNRDSLDPECLFVTSFRTNFPSLVITLIDEYAKNSHEAVVVELGIFYSEYCDGELMS